MTTLERLAHTGIDLAQRLAPDDAVRWGMRRAISGRLRTEAARSDVDRAEWLETWHRGPIAVQPATANDQHYEVPTSLFESMLGPRLKYSCCLWTRAGDLEEAEEAMLAATVEGASIEDGMTVLDLGCGWGSLAGYITERFPGCRVVAVSNSSTQGEYIAARYPAVDHRRADVNVFEPDESFDRVVSVEMVEHVRNHPALFARVRRWLSSDGAAFVHHFSHRRWFWPFEDDGPGDWMARTFFTGGIMPSHELLPSVLPDWEATEHTWFDGYHYAATLEAWLDRLDSVDIPGTQDWRWFLMACAELFARGTEFGVTHLALRPR